MESVRSKQLLKSKRHHPGSNRRTLDHLPSVMRPMSYCVRERPQPNSKKILWHDSYVILWAHPEVPGSIPTMDFSFLFSSETAPMWLIYLFANFNDTIQSKLNPSKKNGINKKQKTFETKGHHPGLDQWILDPSRVSYQWAIVATAEF